MPRRAPKPTPDAPRSAVVTGAARGIGRQVAAELVRRGYLVVVTDLEESEVRATAAAIGAHEGRVLDVTDEEATERLAQEVAGLAPLGVWVCNAGVGFDGDLSDLTSGQVRTLVDVNLLGVVWGARAATEVFRTQRATGTVGGDILVTASLSAHGPVPGLSLYAATKAAVLSLSSALAAELRPDRIGVHAICPDGVATPMIAQMEQGGRAQELVASGTLFTPERVATELVDMIGTRRVYRTLPRWRGVLLRKTALMPGPMLRLEPLMRLKGRRTVKQGKFG